MASTTTKRAELTRELNLTEFDNNIEAIRENQTRSIDNAVEVETLRQASAIFSVADETAMTSKWTSEDTASRTPIDGTLLIREDSSFYWKWDSSVAEKGVITTTRKIKKATVIEAANDDYASSGQVHTVKTALEATLADKLNSADLPGLTTSNPDDADQTKLAQISAVKAERTARENADTTLQENIDEEKNLRETAIKNLQIVQTSSGDFLIADSEFNAVFQIKNITSETDFLPSESLLSRILKTISFQGTGVKFTDKDSNIGFEVEPLTGETNFNPSKKLINKIVSPNIDVSNITNPSEIIHVILYGQSLSAGYDAFPLQSTMQKYDALMFNSGAIYDEDDFLTNTTSLVPLVEQTLGSQGETPASGIAQSIKETYEYYTGIYPENQGFQVLVTACGVGGENIEDLVPTASAFQRVRNAIDKGNSLATSLGKTYKVVATAWLQGESNPSQDIATTTYKSNLKLIQSGIDSYAKSVTSQTEDVPLFTYQTCTGLNPAIAQLELSKEDELVQCTGPIYAFRQNLIHFNGASSYDYGYQIGQFIFQRIFNNKAIKPLAPTDIVVRGNNILVRFSDPNYKIKLDNYWDLMYGDKTGNLYDEDKDYNLDYYTDKSNYGFSIKNGSDEEIITAVTKIDSQTLQLTCSESPVNFLLKYASKRYTMLFQGGSYFGNRTYGGVYAELPLYSQTTQGAYNKTWCVQFIKQL